MRTASVINKLGITDFTEIERSKIGELIYKKSVQLEIKTRKGSRDKRVYPKSFVPTMEKIVKQYQWLKKKQSEVNTS